MRDQGGELVLPSGAMAEDGMPNRVVALFPVGMGAGAAAEVGGQLGTAWRGWVRDALRLNKDESTPDTPGFPVVQWVCVPAGQGGYTEQWHRAQRLLAARRRVRDFPWVEYTGRDLCSLAPRWPAEPVPRRLPAHERSVLSAVGWVKRRWRYVHRDIAGFPSTLSIASAPYRMAILERLSDASVRDQVGRLRQAVGEVAAALTPGSEGREAPVPGLPSAGDELAEWLAANGGPWVYLDRWQADALIRDAGVKLDDPRRAAVGPVVDSGYRVARELGRLMEQAGIPAPASYLAVIVQDLDGMGRFLGGQTRNTARQRVGVTAENHRAVSAQLQDLASAQREALRAGEFHGVPVYAGGDDLLAFAPAVTAMSAARRCEQAVPPELPTASTAVLFFHYHASLQGAMSRARDLLKEAKAAVPGKHGLAVGYLRRSGVSTASIQPWAGPDGTSSADLFGIFAAGSGPRLSPRLVADLDRDAGELESLSLESEHLYRAELARLVRRHAEGDGAGGRGAADRAAAALQWLGSNEYAERSLRGARGSRPQFAARVGVFLRQEAR